MLSGSLLNAKKPSSLLNAKNYWTYLHQQNSEITIIKVSFVSTMTTFLVTWLQHNRELGLGRTLFPAGQTKTCQLLHKTFCMFRCWDVDWWPVKGTTSSWPLLRNLDLALNSAKYPDLPLRCSMYVTDDRSHSKCMILGSYDMTVLRWLAIALETSFFGSPCLVLLYFIYNTFSA